MQKSIDDIDFEKSGGLVPVIVQDYNTKDVLTLAYTNRESLQKTKDTGKSWFFSRSRNKLWMKGEESGNTQQVKDILVDCDSDAIIYLVEPSGPACHTGEKVCFHNALD
ncbi:MAG: phosphoribosyl-AMP cyclohydrolase [Nitrosopumilaceae archaeon]|nr:phosphoribosyl-AMP cyclohydrolase [Nitrosopumilaceae archaeon]